MSCSLAIDAPQRDCINFVMWDSRGGRGEQCFAGSGRRLRGIMRKSVSSRSLLGPALLASTMLAGVPAFAQQTGQAELETITVTAEKHAEDLQKVPMNVQALTAQRLTDLGATDFTKFAP
jgi:hypothetical protein